MNFFLQVVYLLSYLNKMNRLIVNASRRVLCSTRTSGLRYCSTTKSDEAYLAVTDNKSTVTLTERDVTELFKQIVKEDENMKKTFIKNFCHIPFNIETYDLSHRMEILRALLRKDDISSYPLDIQQKMLDSFLHSTLLKELNTRKLTPYHLDDIKVLLNKLKQSIGEKEFNRYIKDNFPELFVKPIEQVNTKYAFDVNDHEKPFVCKMKAYLEKLEK